MAKQLCKVMIVVSCLGFAPVLILLRNGLFGIFQYFTSDTYYYLSVARHSANLKFMTFDGSFATNGFHPLWQYILKYVMAIPWIAISEERQLGAVFVLSSILTILGFAMFARVLYRISGNFGVSLIATVPGIFFLLVLPVSMNYGSTWSFMNGMETPLSILWFGLVALLLFNSEFYLHPTLPGHFIMAVLLTLMTLTRLDDIFIFFPYLILMVCVNWRNRRNLVALLGSLSIPVVLIGGYLVSNYLQMGYFLPLSGVAKSSFSLGYNLSYFLNTIIPLNLFIPPEFHWSEGSMRALQMFVPLIAALVWMIHWMRSKGSESWRDYFHHHPIDGTISILATYVILKCAYNITFVNLWQQGHWYYPICIMIFNLLIVKWASGFFQHLSRQRRLVINIASILFVIFIANAYTNAKVQSGYSRYFYDFWSGRDQIEKELLRSSGKGIVEIDDGVISYSLDIPTMSGSGLNLDRAAFEARRNGDLLGTAYNRGFNVIGVVNPDYFVYTNSMLVDDSMIREGLKVFLPTEQLNQWQYRIIYKDKTSPAVFIGFKPTQEATNPP
ncbi:MAG: hypothetical protein PHQ40_00335 [Anaerolineaceae bacterium]|nr:hypothetical protein [Anaerolineaceae bacterium]MDD5367503.1 hypothetical protein [Anaerolineaceae bacterium]